MVTISIPGHRFTGIKLVIFDKDGTLMELHHYWTEMCKLRVNLIAEKFSLTTNQKNIMLYEMGVDITHKKLRSNGPVGIKKREVVMQAAIDYLASIGYRKTKATCQQVFEEVDTKSSGMLNYLVIPIPGAREVIDTLALSGCKIAIATTDRAHRAALAMEEMGFRNKIDMVIGADCVSETKPDPEMVISILNKLNIKKSQTLLIGDAITDIEMGNRAGLAGTIAVLTGQTPRNFLKKNTPYVINSVAEIAVTNNE